MGGFALIIEKLFEYIGYARFWTIVDAFEQGIILRLGKYHRTLEPGLHWIIPFMERVIVDNVVPSTFHVGPISVTTKDGKTVTLAGVVTWSIKDIRTFLLEVEDAESVIEDSSYGTLGDMTRERNWDQLIEPRSRFKFYVEKRLIRTMRKYGVRVERFQFTDMTTSRTIRMIGMNFGDD